MDLKKNAANIITGFRMLGTLVMVFMPTLSKGFFIAYTFAGVTDVLDGFVARRTGTTSDFGARLDSIADLLFYTCMMLKILPKLIAALPAYIMYLIYSIFGFRLCVYIYVGITKHKFISNHTILNKATGLMLFFVPYLITTPIITFYSGTICGVAILGACYDIKLLRTPDTKGKHIIP